MYINKKIASRWLPYKTQNSSTTASLTDIELKFGSSLCILVDDSHHVRSLPKTLVLPVVDIPLG